MTPDSLPTYFGLRTSDFELRVLAALKGLACGDAIGKQTETLSRDGVRRWYPEGIAGFEGPPGSIIPRYVGNAKREWRIGETTDDTERTMAVARAILQDGKEERRRVRHASVGRELLTCRKCIHPGLRSLWEFHQAGDPARVADRHDGCGAAVRVSPVGILYRSDRLDDIVAAAREASIPTHGGPLALAAAAATAAAVSAAIDGASGPEVFAVAERAASQAERSSTSGAGTPFADALRRARVALAEWGALHPESVAARCFPDGPLTIVPLAIALGTIADSAEDAILTAANVGGDSDSVASIAGAILGARHPDTVPEEWYEIVRTVNDLDVVSLADQLSALRH
jgi:ADP-ribosylglycohydrolase